MASLRFCLTNLLESGALLNGTGGGAPALDEVSPWLMSNAMNRDRGMVWQGTVTGNYDVDLAAQSIIEVFAILGVRGAPSSAAGISSVACKVQTGAYAPAGAFTTVGTATMTTFRDGGVIGTGTADTVRFTVTTSTAFTVGRLFAGAISTDLTFVSSPGYSRRWIDPILENRMSDNSPFITYSGEGHWEYSLPYEGVNSTLFSALLEIGRTRRTFLLIDRDNTIYEARVRAPFEHTLMHDAPDWQNTALILETLP